MNSMLIAIMCVLIVFILSMMFIFKWDLKQMNEYFKTKHGKGVAKGILVAIGLFILITIGSYAFSDDEKGEWFSYGEAFLGMESANGVSPQCWSDGPSDKLTSNLGVKANVYRSHDKRFEVNAIYTHHSCVFNPDRNTYDAVGVQFTYKLWGN